MGILFTADSYEIVANARDSILADRAAMLAWRIRYEVAGARDDNYGQRDGPKPYNEDWDTNTVQGNWDFVDLGTRLPGGQPLTLAIDGAGLSLSDHQVVFGTTANDTRLGNLFFGATSTITSLRADLNGAQFTIDATLSRDEIVAQARDSIAWRHALCKLNSIVIIGASVGGSAGSAANYQAWSRAA